MRERESSSLLGLGSKQEQISKSDSKSRTRVESISCVPLFSKRQIDNPVVSEHILSVSSVHSHENVQRNMIWCCG